MKNCKRGPGRGREDDGRDQLSRRLDSYKYFIHLMRRRMIKREMEKRGVCGGGGELEGDCLVGL